MRADVPASVAGPAFVPEAGRPGARRLWVLDRALHIIVALLFGGDFSGFATPRVRGAKPRARRRSNLGFQMVK
jgi:hypothetical protein